MIFNMVGGGGGSGATLVVSSPANVSVTVSKDDKSYTKNSGSLGSATFKGLATGTWTVTISGNGQTATKTIEITADYAITIAFFSASINITYPANSNCVVTNSGGQTVASDTNTGSSTKTWTATVSATGTYTVTATATDGSGKSKSQSVSITSDGQSESVSLSYELVLYSPGDTHDNVSGGWISNVEITEEYEGSIKFTNGYIDLISGYHNTRNACTANKIDLTGYSKLQFTYKWINSNTGYSTWFGISGDQNAYGYSDEAINKSFVSYYHTPGGDSGKKITRYLDISSLSGEYYVKFQLANSEKAQIYECKLI